MAASGFRAGFGAWAVWLRNFRVWRRSWKTSLVGSVGEPLFYFLGLGYGLGTIVPPVAGEPYLHFVSPGLLLSCAMYSTTVEATYGVFTRMEHQKVHAGMLLAPLTFREIVAGELLWATTKGMLSGGTVLLLAILLGIGERWSPLFALPLLFLAGILFSALGLVVVTFARGYDFFNYYFTLAISPMFFFSGIFFPLGALGDWGPRVAWFSPLTHLTTLSRALFRGEGGAHLLPDVLWLSLFTMLAVAAALRLTSRRFAQ